MNSLNHSYQEKRNYIRMKVDAPVAIKILTDNSSLHGICRDLSGGGMLIEMDSTLPIGTETEVVISSGHGHNPMLKAKATVTRLFSKPDAKESTCTLGMQIIEVLN